MERASLITCSVFLLTFGFMLAFGSLFFIVIGFEVPQTLPLLTIGLIIVLIGALIRAWVDYSELVKRTGNRV